MGARPVIELFSGDIRELNFTVQDENGAAVNISAYTDIDLAIYALDGDEPTGAALVSSNLAGTLDLVGGGTTGNFKWTPTAANSASLAGDYYLEVRLENATGLFTTCTPCILRVKGDLITS